MIQRIRAKSDANGPLGTGGTTAAGNGEVVVQNMPSEDTLSMQQDTTGSTSTIYLQAITPNTPAGEPSQAYGALVIAQDVTGATPLLQDVTSSNAIASTGGDGGASAAISFGEVEAGPVLQWGRSP